MCKYNDKIFSFILKNRLLKKEKSTTHTFLTTDPINTLLVKSNNKFVCNYFILNSNENQSQFQKSKPIKEIIDIIFKKFTKYENH